MNTRPANVSVLAGTWTVDPTATVAAFHATGIGGHQVRGTIPVDSGLVEVGGSGRPLGVDTVLDASEIDSGNPRRDKDLRSKRFLKVDTHPVIRFSGGDVRETPTGWTVAGVLSAAGERCPVTLDVRLTAGTPHDTECRVVATATIDRTSLGIKAPSFMVRRTVRLEIDALLRRA